MEEVRKEEGKEQLNEAQKLSQEYFQKCCEVGQLRHQLDQLSSQKFKLKKTLMSLSEK